MSDAPDQGAQPAAPNRTETTASVLASVKDLLPAVALSVALTLLVFFAVPESNHDPVLAIISGMLGFLTGRASAPRQEPPAPSA